jgi:hypothetical protein
MESGGFVCKSTETGLTCTNAAGHGFVISKEVLKFFQLERFRFD